MNYTTIALIVNLLFVIILVAGFLVGLWRGLKKSAVNVIFAFAAALLAFFVTIPVTNAILGISLNGTPLKETLVNMILSQESIKNLVTSVPSLETLIAGIPAAIAGTIMFIILTCLAEGIFYIIYKIVAIAFLRNKKTDDDEEPPKKHRLLGGAVGLVKTFVVLVFAFLPLTALTGLFQDLTKENDYFQSSAQAAALTDEQQSHNILTKNLPQIALDGVKAFDDSAFGIFGGVFGLDNAVFDYYANVDIEGQKVYIRQEIETYWQAVDLYTCITNADGRQLKELDFEKVDPVINGILDSGLYNTVVTDALTAIVTDYDQIGLIPADTLDQFKDVLDAVAVDLNATSDKAAYFSDDINKIYDMFKSMAQSGLIDDINSLESKELTDILDMFSKEENQDAFATCLNDLFTTNIVRAAAKPVVKLALGGIIEDIDQIAANTANWQDEDWQAVADNLVDSITYAQDLMAEVDLTKILDDPLVLLQEKEGGGYYDLAKIFENLGGLVDTLRANKLFVNSEGTPIVDVMLDGNFELPEEIIHLGSGDLDFSPTTQDKDIQKTPYTVLFTKVFLPPMKNLQGELYNYFTADQVNMIGLFKLIADKNNPGEDDTQKHFLTETILPLLQVKPTDTILKDELLKALGTSNDKVDLSVLQDFFPKGEKPQEPDPTGKLKDEYDKELEKYQQELADYKAQLANYYAQWENDLNQIDILVRALVAVDLGEGQTAIDLMLAQSPDVPGLLKALKPEVDSETPEKYLTGGKLSDIIKPILQANSMGGLAGLVFSQLNTTLNSLIDNGNIAISYNHADYVGEDSQTQEVADIFENFLAIYNLKEDNADLDKLEKMLAKPELGMLLNALSANTYRKENHGKQNTGAFASVFTSITSYFDSISQNHFSTICNQKGGLDKIEDFKQVLSELASYIQSLVPGR